jgi:hypothetical protein
MAPLLSMKVLTSLAQTVSASKLLTIRRLLQRNRPHHPLQFKILPSLTEDTNNGNCQSACLATGYLLLGTADAFNCWCDNVMNLKFNKLLESYCNGSLRCRHRNLQRILRRKRLQRVNDTYFSTPPNPDLGMGNLGLTRSLLWRLPYPAKFCRRVPANFWVTDIYKTPGIARVLRVSRVK